MKPRDTKREEFYNKVYRDGTKPSEYVSGIEDIDKSSAKAERDKALDDLKNCRSDKANYKEYGGIREKQAEELRAKLAVVLKTCRDVGICPYCGSQTKLMNPSPNKFFQKCPKGCLDKEVLEK